MDEKTRGARGEARTQNDAFFPAFTRHQRFKRRCLLQDVIFLMCTLRNVARVRQLLIFFVLAVESFTLPAVHRFFFFHLSDGPRDIK